MGSVSCSPLLKGVTDPLAVLAIVSAHPILCWSEPSSTFYPLRDKGWVEYKEGHWRITKEGREVFKPDPETPKPTKQSLSDFFGL